ncbi:hypothetical protein GCM10009117_23880 [Gangjinia marincola]|uniref:Uncharacterized protein n=1 Tax=Gangjinia marincola TaxID=578463 RepID=A0ABN1MK06_9FLAO
MKALTEYMLQYSFVFGSIALIMSLLLFFVIIYSKSKRMNDHDVMSWKAYVNTWAVAIMLFVLGIFLVLR